MVKEENYNHLNNGGFVLFRFRNICLLGHYSKNAKKAYLQDLIDLLASILISIFTIAISPFSLLKMLYKFLPKFRLIR